MTSPQYSIQRRLTIERVTTIIVGRQWRVAPFFGAAAFVTRLSLCRFSHYRGDFFAGLLVAATFWAGLLVAATFWAGLLVAATFWAGLLVAATFWAGLLVAASFLAGFAVAATCFGDCDLPRFFAIDSLRAGNKK
jgi:hypothetical protein